jgi:hypothetical protein
MEKNSVLFVIILIFSACSLFQDWKPKGGVSVSDFRILDSSGIRYYVVNYAITNTGAVKIIQSTVTIKVSTDQGQYHQTAVNQTQILPDGEVYSLVQIQFLTNMELIISINHKKY